MVFGSERDQIFGESVEFAVDNDFSLFVGKVGDIRKCRPQVVACSADVAAVEVSGVEKSAASDIDKGIVVG